MSVAYNYGDILAIMAMKKDDPIAQDLSSVGRTRSLAARLILRQSKIAFLVLKRLFLKLNLEDPYDILYERYWQIVFQE